MIEVADTSLDYDTGLKAATYAELGVREYWVVNARTLETIVHRVPEERGNGYLDKATVALAAELIPQWVPSIRLRLSDLGID